MTLFCHGGIDGGRVPRLNPLYLAVLSTLLLWQGQAEAAPAGRQGAAASTQPDATDVQFDSGFLVHADQQRIDLSRFEKSNGVLPGDYRVDLYVNGDSVTRAQVPFRAAADGKDAQPCFGRALLEELGVDLLKLPGDVRDRLKADDACVGLPEAIADASAAFVFDEQRLSLSIPQGVLRRTPRGYVSPERWEAGVTTGMLNYSADLYTTRNNDGPSLTQGFAGLTAGFNVGNWHFRHQGSYSWSNNNGGHYQDIATYVQRDLPRLTSQLTIGEAYTSGELFDSTQFRGVKLSTDERMMPDSARGYAPVLRGIARSNARVTVSQNGVKIYETTVAPGAFEIDDLYATGYGGDLNVSVKEADGSVHEFSVPYAAVPLALRPGTHRYSFVAGAVRTAQSSRNPLFMQGTWRQGLTNLVTGYGGVTAAQGYLSFMLGSALNTSVGAFGVDVTQATTVAPGTRRFHGTSARVSYAKSITQTSTDIAIAAYRYSTSGYFGLNDAMLMRDQVERGGSPDDIARQRSRASLSVNQNLGARFGQFGMTLSGSNYWNRPGSDITYAASYSNVFRRITYRLSVTRENGSLGNRNTTFYASVSIPLGRERPVIASSALSFDTNGRAQAQATLSGSAGRDDALFYSVSGNHASQDGGASTNGSGTVVYRAPYAELTASAGVGQGYQQASVGARGGVVVHPGGVTLSQPLSDTFAVVEAPGSAGARVLNSQGVRMDSRGYAVVPMLTPYSINEVELDPTGLPLDVELSVTAQQVVPRAGAVPLIRFPTVVGRAALIAARQAGGEALPFGAQVLNAAGTEVGVVGQGGRILARGLDEHGTLTVRWGNEGGASCAMPYTLAAAKGQQPARSYQQIETTCGPAAD
ncbi:MULTISPECIES: fimbria/pilus outer membrane usher protein [Cupriavidus]